MCDMDYEPMLTIVDDGTKRMVLCPTHYLAKFLGAVKEEDIPCGPSEVNLEGTCDVCEKEKIFFQESGTVYEVCEEHMQKLILHELSPEEYKILHTKHPEAFLLHSDFYDPELEKKKSRALDKLIKERIRNESEMK